MNSEQQCHKAESALIHALSLLRDGQQAQALDYAIIAVGRIGALLPQEAITRVAESVADRAKGAAECHAG